MSSTLCVYVCVSMCVCVLHYFQLCLRVFYLKLNLKFNETNEMFFEMFDLID